MRRRCAARLGVSRCWVGFGALNRHDRCCSVEVGGLGGCEWSPPSGFDTANREGRVIRIPAGKYLHRSQILLDSFHTLENPCPEKEMIRLTALAGWCHLSGWAESVLRGPFMSQKSVSSAI